MANASEGSSRTPEAVEQEIARTRAELDETLDVLVERLSPQEIKDRAVQYAKSTASDMGATVQRNPVPSALAAGALLTALMWANRRHARRVRAQEELSRLIWERIAAALERQDVLSRARSAVSSAVDTLGGFALDAHETVSHAVGDATEQTRQMLSSEAARPVVDSARRMVASIEDRSRERPLVALGIALVLGAILTRSMRL